MDIDERAIGQWPNIACEPGQAGKYKPAGRAQDARLDEFKRMLNAFGGASEWYGALSADPDARQSRIDKAGREADELFKRLVGMFEEGR